jgi:hypothetical protein
MGTPSSGYQIRSHIADLSVAAFSGKSHRPQFAKKVLIGYFIFGISTHLFVIAMILQQGHVQTWHLVMSISMGSLGVSVYYPAQFAFNQEVLAREQYSALSGAIEVQWQGGAMVAGGLASFLITRVPLTLDIAAGHLHFHGRSFCPRFCTVPAESEIGLERRIRVEIDA